MAIAAATTARPAAAMSHRIRRLPATVIFSEDLSYSP
jgi:hypothetical protein